MADWKWEVCENLAEHWLPRKDPPLVLSPTIPSMEEATVDNLIEVDTWQ